MPKNVKKGKNTTRIVKKIEFIAVEDLPEGETYGIIEKELGNRNFLAKLYNGIEFKCRITAGKRKKREFLVKKDCLVRVSPNSSKENKLYEIIAVYPSNLRIKFENKGYFDKLKVHPDDFTEEDIGVWWEGKEEEKEKEEEFNIDDI